MDLEARCKAYINDKLPTEERKKLETRISNGDQEVISILKRLRSFENPARNSDAGPQYVDESSSDLRSYIPDEDEKNEAPDNQNAEIADAEINTEPEDTSYKRFGNTMLKIAGGIIGLLVFILAYIQWQNENMEQHIQVLENRLEQYNETVEAKNMQFRDTYQQLDHLIAILGGNNVEYIPFTGNDNHLENAVMIWDRSTFRTAMVFPNASLPENQAFKFWVRNRENEWHNLGSVNKIEHDSLYTEWNASALTKAVQIHIRLDSTSQHSSTPESGTLVADFQLPE